MNIDVMGMINPVNERKPATHYVLDDGRVWNIAEGAFVSSVSEGSVPVPCRDGQGNSTLEGLIACLDFYGYPKGELKTGEEYASEAREKRNALLAETDYLMLPDYPLPEEKFQAFAAYRQALRDVPLQSGFPRQIDWPVKP
jgi:hypothetical protein